MPTLWEILEMEDKSRMDVMGQLCRYQEAVIVLRQQDKSLVLEACNILDGISPVMHSLSLTIRNLMAVLYPGDQQVETQKERAEVIQKYLDHGAVVQLETQESMKAACEEVSLVFPKQNYICLECNTAFSSKYRKRNCPQCKSKRIKKTKDQVR